MGGNGHPIYNAKQYEHLNMYVGSLTSPVN